MYSNIVAKATLLLELIMVRQRLLFVPNFVQDNINSLLCSACAD